MATGKSCSPPKLQLTFPSFMFLKGVRSTRFKPLQWERRGNCIQCTSHRLNSGGYVWIRRRGFSTRTLHRIIGIRKHGNHPCTRHTCDNRWCINPDHIIPGTLADNNRDRKMRGRNADTRGEKNPFHKLTNTNVLEIRKLLQHGIPQRQIANQFGVSQHPIKCINLNRTWKHIPMKNTTNINQKGGNHQ
jgi:hypothetical protein